LMTDPDFNLLIALDALLAEASVAGAARRLNLSTSAMSRTLGRLREVTGDPLLVRAGRTMVLTPYAQASRDRTRNAVLEARAVLQPSAVELNLATLDRVFTLRTNDGFVEAFGPALIAAVARAAPQVCLRFMPKPEKNSRYLREGLVDLEIGVQSNMGPEIRLQALFRDRFVGVVRKDHPLAASDTVRVAEYVAWGHVIASRRGQSAGPVDEALAEMGLTRRVVSVVPGFPSALAVAQASDLVALVPASFLHQTEAQTRLHWFELPFKTRPITISQMWHPRMEVDPAHRWLRQTVLTVCQQQYPGQSG
jgi:DNA-binding transcriptional LysR family regulator